MFSLRHFNLPNSNHQPYYIQRKKRFFAWKFCFFALIVLPLPSRKGNKHFLTNKNSMNNYETVFIVTPVLSEAQVQEVADKFQGVITENGGQIVNRENWGLKKLAYPIQKKTTGFYFLIEFTGEGSIINTLETQYRRDERVIRFLTFKQDKFAVEYAEKRRAKLANKQEE